MILFELFTNLIKQRIPLLRILTIQLEKKYPVHVIWTERRMLKLVFIVKYLLLLSYETAAEFYNLGHIQK